MPRPARFRFKLNMRSGKGMFCEFYGDTEEDAKHIFGILRNQVAENYGALVEVRAQNGNRFWLRPCDVESIVVGDR